MPAHRTCVRTVLAGLCALLLSVGTGEAQQPGRIFLWKIQSGAHVLFLAGSVHALSADVYPLAPGFERAFTASRALVEEIDMAEADPTRGPSLLAKGMYLDGRTFNQAVSPQTVERVRAKLQGTPLALELIQPMKPWMVMLMLEAVGLQSAGLEPALGLDKHFYDRARSGGKTVVGLESAASQIDRFDQLPDATQEQMLRSALEEMDAERENLRELVAAWKSGDAASMERLLLAAFASNPAAYTSLIVERNRNWMPRLDACLSRDEGCFAVVGAAHLVGPQGLLALLRERGYLVEQQ
jgi:uncharacterized protein YbaP (TraB family)